MTIPVCLSFCFLLPLAGLFIYLLSVFRLSFSTAFLSPFPLSLSFSPVTLFLVRIFYAGRHLPRLTSLLSDFLSIHKATVYPVLTFQAQEEEWRGRERASQSKSKREREEGKKEVREKGTRRDRAQPYQPAANLSRYCSASGHTRQSRSTSSSSSTYTCAFSKTPRAITIAIAMSVSVILAVGPLGRCGMCGGIRAGARHIWPSLAGDELASPRVVLVEHAGFLRKQPVGPAACHARQVGCE